MIIHPLKQGLKHAVIELPAGQAVGHDYSSTKTRIETYIIWMINVHGIQVMIIHPLKQGLKLFNHNTPPNKQRVMIIHPLKQGLKLFVWQK